MSFQRLDQPAAAAETCRRWRDEGATIGFVPTMGALHDGHLELVRRAARDNARVVVSVFVNPLQFDDPRDLAAYPRDFAGDCALLAGAGADLAFTGDLLGFFPEVDDAREIEKVDPGPAARELEGAHRPGHFDGVATIVRRLFDLVRPHVAYFGEKDYQQTLVVRHVAGAHGPRVVVVPTVREPSGLARSSRNERLEPGVRARAAVVYRALRSAAEAFAHGERDRARLERVLRDALASEPDLAVEYAELRDPASLAPLPARVPDAGCRALVAVRLGGVRLIDNLGLGAERS
jgi:pantoate--beta-alanine ligase